MVNSFKFVELCFSPDLKTCFSIASVYISAISVVNSVSKNEASEDQTTNGGFFVNDNYTNVSVSYISNHVLWNCRNHSSSHKYYKILYSGVLIFLSFALLWTMKFKSLEKLKTFSFFAVLVIRISFFILLTSYDVGVWACLRGPSEIVYNEESSTVELQIDEKILCYQVYGSIISLCFFALGIILAVISAKHKSKETKDEFCTEYTKEVDDNYSDLTMIKTGSITMCEIAKRTKNKTIKLSILE